MGRAMHTGTRIWRGRGGLRYSRFYSRFLNRRMQESRISAAANCPHSHSVCAVFWRFSQYLCGFPAI